MIKSIWIILPIILFLLFSYVSAQEEKTKSGGGIIYLIRGQANLESRQYDQAISEFTKAIKIDPKDALAYSSRGLAYELKGQYDQAISDYTKALEIDPRSASTYISRGGAYTAKGQFDQAILDYNKAIEIDPRKALAYKDRGDAYELKGQYDRAISDYTKALEIDPKDAGAYRSRGYTYSLKDQYDRAISDYNKALEIDPKDAEAYNNLAWILATVKTSSLRNGKKAVELALKACELSNWKNLGYLDTLAAAYARAGDFNNAVKWQAKALESPELAKNTEAQQRFKFYKERKPWPAD
jgi:tetratricopeptide (TPR) repeat protein